jgi:dihydroorotate dehydrogenase
MAGKIATHVAQGKPLTGMAMAFWPDRHVSRREALSSARRLRQEREMRIAPDFSFPGLFSAAAMRVLRRFDPEQAHALATGGLMLGLGGPRAASDPALAVEALGLHFANPIGIAAGFDKNGRVVRPLARLGFGFVEAGTVTPRPQAGNPRPRLFRLGEDAAVINRMGFNNGGIDALLARMARQKRVPGVPVGINLGINKEGAEPLRDYPALVRAAAPLADYLVINLSSPNTPGLRDLQGAARIAPLLEAIAASGAVPRPLLVKLAPDLPEPELPAIVEAAISGGAAGLIISNTTLARPDWLRSPHAGEAGGLSGRPLRARSTAMLASVARIAQGRLVLVGCGGIERAEHVLDKVKAGADLVQLYTGLVLHGPQLLRRLLADLSVLLREQGIHRLSDAKGTAL